MEEEEGQHAFRQGEYERAEELFGEALRGDGDNAVLWANRCAARLKLQQVAEPSVCLC